MKICISSQGDNLNAPLDPRFGRAMYFLIVNKKGKLLKAIKNTGTQAMHGAGVTAAQIVADEKVDVVISRNIGPNAFMALASLGIKIFLGTPGMTVKDAFEAYQDGQLSEASAATGPGHRGFGPPSPRFRGAGRGPGRRGFGPGPGMGPPSPGLRGAGRGRGRGGRFNY